MRSGVFLIAVAAIGLGIYNNNPNLQAHLEEARDRLTLPYRVLRLQSEPPAETLQVPVKGVVARGIGNSWHAPRPGGRRHEGQDIFAKRGTPVVAAAPGFVVRVSEGGLGGIAVFVVGSGGRTYYYAHLQDYAEGLGVGDEVQAGTVLGYVGNTGNARGTPPHLHFGMYTLEGPMDPLPLLHSPTKLS